jgi:uncharacterized membrane protein
MLDRGYRKRLAADLPKWREAGWVTSEGASAILAALPGGRATFGLATVVGMFGGLLVGLGVIAFVSANWQEIPRLARLGLLAAALALAYGAAGVLDRRNLRIFAEAALLIAGLVFAATIALVGQSYHLSGEFADAIVLWLIGIFAAAVLTGSPTMTALGLIGGAFWTYVVVIDLEIPGPHWPGLVPIIGGAAIATAIGSRNDRLLSVLAFLFWAVLAIGSSSDLYNWSFTGSIVLGIAVALMLFTLGAALTGLGNERIAALGRDMLWPALVAILIGLGVEQVADERVVGAQTLTTIVIAVMAIAVALAALAAARKGLTAIDAAAIAAIGIMAFGYAHNMPSDEMWSRIAGGVMVLVAAIWAVNLGQTGVAGSGKATGLFALGAEVVYLYAVTFGSLMNTAVAFLLGGVLFMVLAWGLYRLDRHLARRGAGTPATASEVAP